MRSVSASYVCKRCDVAGHHITECPTLSDNTFDSPPRPDYTCHACGKKGDHFIHSCPKKIPARFRKKNTTDPDQSEKGPDDLWLVPASSASRPSARKEPSASRPVIRKEKSLKLRPGKAKKSSENVSKRSEDVVLAGDGRKRRRTAGSIDSYRPPARDESPSAGPTKRAKMRRSTLKEGRLSPWDTDSPDEVDVGVAPRSIFQIDTVGSRTTTSSDVPRDDHAHKTARLEADKFLTDLQKEMEEKNEQSAVPVHPGFPSLEELLRAVSQEGSEAESQEMQIETSSANGASVDEDDTRSYQGLDVPEDIAMAAGIDWPSSPATLPAPPIIEPYVTSKPLCSKYDAEVHEIFKDRSNVYIRKHVRRTALDLWPRSNPTPEQKRLTAREKSVDSARDRRSVSLIICPEGENILGGPPSTGETSPRPEDENIATETVIQI